MKWWQSRKRHADLERELCSDLELEEEEQRERGLPPEDALYAARRAFGNVTLIREQTHEAWGWTPLERLLQDLNYALRQLTRAPGFAMTAILVLTLGIGAAAAIFAFVDAALLQPLPYFNPSRLVAISESSADDPRWPLSYPDYADWQRRNNTFQSIAIYAREGYLLRTPSGEEPINAERVSGDFFRMLGVQPILGRDFAQGENRPGGPNIALLSYGTWLHRFSGQRDIIGRSIELNDNAYTVVGVLPQSFVFAPAGGAGFWVPINKLSYHEQFRSFYRFSGIARLRDGVTIEQARAEMAGIAEQIQRQYSVSGHPSSASVIPFYEIVVGHIRLVLLMLLGGAVLLLLIACANVSSLLLARTENRRQEIAIRIALGGSSARIVQQFTIEGLILALSGAIAGLLLSLGAIRVLREMVPKDMASNMPFLESAGLNSHTVTFLFAIMLAVALLLTTIPQVRLPSRRVRDALAAGGRSATSVVWQRFGSNLVMVELAVATVLLAGAGLLGQSLYRLLHVPLGFDPTNLASLRVTVPDTYYRTDQQMEELYQEITQRMASLPGVESAGMTTELPAQCDCNTDEVRFPDRPDLGDHNSTLERHTSPAYFPTLQARLLRGRYFNSGDSASTPRVAVINESFARKYFPQQSPLGEQIANNESGHPSVWTIVGIVEDIHEVPLDTPDAPVEYFSLNQTHDHSFTLVVLARQQAATILPAIVSSLHSISSTLGTSDETTLSEEIASTQEALLHRFSAWLVGGFAAIALILSTIGLYGVIAYSVSQRTREIGVRMALGAPRGSVYRLILGQAGWVSATGLVAGLVCAVGVALLMRSMLFGVTAWDPLTLACVTISLILSSFAASFLPALRAASIDPVQALRNE